MGITHNTQRPGHGHILGQPGVLQEALYHGVAAKRSAFWLRTGYDRPDVEAAYQARVPVANNGALDATALPEPARMPSLAADRKLAWNHNNAVGGKWHIGDFGSVRAHEPPPTWRGTDP